LSDFAEVIVQIIVGMMGLVELDLDLVEVVKGGIYGGSSSDKSLSCLEAAHIRDIESNSVMVCELPLLPTHSPT
jgi:hypothetical protein